MDNQVDVARARSVWYQAEDVEEWAAHARSEIVRLRGALEEATQRARGTEHQLRLLAKADEDITRIVDRSQAEIERSRTATDSLLVRRACQEGDRLVLEARRQALELVAESRTWMAELYSCAWGADPPDPSSADQSPGQRRADSGHQVINDLPTCLALLRDVLIEKGQTGAPTSDRFPQAVVRPSHIRPLETELYEPDIIGLAGEGLASDGTDGPDSDGGHGPEAARALSVARWASGQILSATRKALAAAYDFADADVLSAPSVGIILSGEQSA